MERIDSLTGLRFLAAAAIVLHHSQTGYFFRPGAFSPFLLETTVSLFFVLSGFVLTLNAGKYASAGYFVAARVGRIWPAHAAAFLFWFLIFFPYSYALLDLKTAIPNLLLLHAWIPSGDYYFSYNAPSWSISCELFFYVCLPFLLAWLSPRPATRFLIAGLLTVAAVAVAQAAFGNSRDIDRSWLVYINPLANLPHFLLGIGAALVFRRIGRSSLPVRRATALEVAVVAIVLAAAGLHPIADAVDASIVKGYLYAAGTAPFHALLILVLARYRGAISRALASSPMVYLGEISYSVYLFHQLVIRWHSDHRDGLASIPGWIQYAGIWLATLAIASIVHFAVERPGRRAFLAAWRLFAPLWTRDPRPAAPSPEFGERLLSER